MADAGQHAVETFIAKWQGVAASAPLSLDEIVARFTARGPWKKRLPQLLEMLIVLGRASKQPDGRYVGQ